MNQTWDEGNITLNNKIIWIEVEVEIIKRMYLKEILC